MPAPPRVYKSPAIVLRQRRLGDADKIVTLYTASYGKVDAVAKGVRRTRSKLAGHVEPLNHGSFVMARGRNLDIITQAQTIEAFQPLREELERLSRSFYAVELVDRFTEDREENFALYRLLLDTLRRLSQGDDLDTVLRYFEVSLLGLLGYRPELEECTSCRSRLQPVTNYWSASAGGVLCKDCLPSDEVVRPLSVNALKVLRLMEKESFSQVARVNVPPDLARELEGHLREYIRYMLEREVRSAAFIDAVRRRPPPPAPAAAAPGDGTG
jgi:DNA repair protein RecO (recombination protein O)